MAFKATETILNAALQAILDLLDAGSGPCTFEFYDGTRPGGPSTAITSQTLLGTLTCSDPAGAVDNAVLTFSAITQDSSADASGTATWCRLKDGDGDAWFDFDVTDMAGAGPVKMLSTTVTAGNPLLMSSATASLAAILEAP